ncbi:hypothetical protein MNBD_ALPHA03-2104 [hydrothermal vent metagenome]|uniref:Oxidoreductase molybdopterin-binding domain-containing protein n=1 Tax=hydrothermal vent metagenome TaxID=652676 RepID=A0A3B1APZ3_9ZZZZ
MVKNNLLSPGQFAIDHFPRFGLTQYADKYSTQSSPLDILISGDVEDKIRLAEKDLDPLTRIEQTSDFHCVTTWTRQNLLWSGYRFKDFYQKIILPNVRPSNKANYVIFRSQDGFRSILPLSDLLADEVLLADRLDGEPLSAKHGAPLRLVTPAHYGYKSTKHLTTIEFWPDESKFHPPMYRFMSHPRARVEFEERGLWFPGWFLRYLYRPQIKSTIKLFEETMK